MMRIQYIQYRHFRFDIFCLFYELSYFRILYNILQNVLVYFCIFGSYSSLDEVWVFTHGILQKVNWCKDNTLWTKIKNASSLLHCTVLKSKCLYLVRNNKCPYMKERFYIDMSFAYGLDISYMFSLNHSAQMSAEFLPIVAFLFM